MRSATTSAQATPLARDQPSKPHGNVRPQPLFPRQEQIARSLHEAVRGIAKVRLVFLASQEVVALRGFSVEQLVVG